MEESNDTIDLLKAHQEVLCHRLKLHLERVSPVLREDLTRALQEEGKLFSPFPVSAVPGRPPSFAGSWGLLTFLVAFHVAPAIDPAWASTAAIAIECLLCALDLLDDVEDGDLTPIVQKLGEPRVLNASTGLLYLAQRSLHALGPLGMPPQRVLLLLDTLQRSALVATTGQLRDLLAESQQAYELSYDDCLSIAREKAGSLMSLACSIGAQCAGANEEVTRLFSTFGEHLGIAHQLDNDAHDLSALVKTPSPSTSSDAATGSPISGGKTDLARGKKTLPVVYAATQFPLQPSTPFADTSKQTDIRRFEKGIIATWGICQLYRKRAQQTLQKIEALQPLAPELRLLLGLE